MASNKNRIRKTKKNVKKMKKGGNSIKKGGYWLYPTDTDKESSWSKLIGKKTSDDVIKDLEAQKQKCIEDIDAKIAKVQETVTTVDSSPAPTESAPPVSEPAPNEYVEPAPSESVESSPESSPESSEQQEQQKVQGGRRKKRTYRKK